MVMLELQILSPLSLTSREDGRLVLDLWNKCLPRLVPDTYGNWEPIDRQFDLENIETVLDAWKWPFLARKKSPRVRFDVWPRKGSQSLHSIWSISVDSAAANQSDLLDFIKKASVVLEADFACLHLLTNHELERGKINNTVSVLNKSATKFTFSVRSKDLQQRIPDLFWVTVFGRPYVKMFGDEKLLSAPVYIAERLQNGAVMLQLSSNLTDLEDKQSELERVRVATVKHLGENAFFKVGSQAYQVPKFAFGQ